MTFTTPRTIPRSIEREGEDGPPIVILPGGGKKTTYTRTTTYAGVIEDRYLIERWQERKVIAGLVERPDLLLSAAAHIFVKKKLNNIAKDAKAAAKADAASIIGTAVHKLAESHDLGLPIGAIPGDYRRDLNAYIATTAGMEHVAVEQFLVHDQLKVGGTPDRISVYEGRPVIADIKTGNIDFGQLKIAMQLAIYSRSENYDPTTGERRPIEVDQDKAIVIHLPAGTGRCELHWVDIGKGWNAVHTATAVREWRRVKGLLTSMTPDQQVQEAVAAYQETVEASIEAPLPEFEADVISVAIYQASSVASLTKLWETYEDQWTDKHTAHAKNRIHVLTRNG